MKNSIATLAILMFALFAGSVTTTLAADKIVKAKTETVKKDAKKCDATCKDAKACTDKKDCKDKCKDAKCTDKKDCKDKKACKSTKACNVDKKVAPAVTK